MNMKTLIGKNQYQEKLKHEYYYSAANSSYCLTIIHAHNNHNIT